MTRRINWPARKRELAVLSGYLVLMILALTLFMGFMFLVAFADKGVLWCQVVLGGLGCLLGAYFVYLWLTQDDVGGRA